MQTLEDKVIAKIYGRGRGWAFTPKEFASLGDARSVGMALTRLTRKGTIRRLARGLYDYPREDPSLGLLPPSTDDIAKALKGRTIPACSLAGPMERISWGFQPGTSESRLPNRRY
jgi:hypothetical protein